VEIIVATPGRLVDFLSRQPPMLSLSRCNFLVLDEAGLYKLNPVHPYLESAWFESAWFESAWFESTWCESAWFESAWFESTLEPKMWFPGLIFCFKIPNLCRYFSADRMLDMGFEPQLRKIVEGSDLPRRDARQTLLFSATFPPALQAVARKSYLRPKVGDVQVELFSWTDA
jgi:hypothetical protein